MVLGTGTFQKGLLEFLKKQGLYVIGVTNKPHEESATACHEIIDVSYQEHEEVLRQYKKKHCTQVLTVASEAALYTQSYIQEPENHKGNSIAFISRFQDKTSYKKLLFEQKLGPQVMNGAVPENMKPPYFIKPKTGSGSHKIRLVECVDQKIHEPDKQLYFNERFIEGKEYGCNFFLEKGKLIYHITTLKKNNKFHVPVAHLITNTPVQEEMRSLIYKVDIALNLNEGFFNMDVIKTGTGLKVIDLSPRLGGNAMTEISRMGYSISEYDFLLKWHLRQKVSAIHTVFKKYIGVYVIGSLKAGTLSHISVIPDNLQPNITEIFWNKRVGDSVEVFDSGSKHLGYVIFTGISKENLFAIYGQVLNYEWFELEEIDVDK